jgi:hypothetical protein
MNSEPDRGFEATSPPASAIEGLWIGSAAALLGLAFGLPIAVGDHFSVALRVEHVSWITCGVKIPRLAKYAQSGSFEVALKTARLKTMASNAAPRHPAHRRTLASPLRRPARFGARAIHRCSGLKACQYRSFFKPRLGVAPVVRYRRSRTNFPWSELGNHRV